jgi:glycine/D-amino acid oxidase-like deaminating enzyme
MDLGPELPGETDVLVVGGGILGTATAFFLAKRTDDVTLVEKDNVASGATGDSSAILRHVYGDRELYSRMAWTAHEFYRNFEAETGYDLDAPDQPLVLWGSERGAHTEDPMDSYETLESLGYPVTRYESGEFPDQFPLFEFDEDIEYAVSDDAAGYSDGTDAASRFARAAADDGARVVTGVTATSVETDGDAVTGLETDEGFVACDHLVVAAGSWTHKLTATADVDLPVTPGREQVLLLDPPEDVTDEEFETIRTTGQGSSQPDGGWWYFRADFGDTIYMGTHTRNDPVDPDTYSRSPDQQRKLEAFEVLDEFAPKLADSDVVGEFCGVYANTPDQGFIIDQVGPEGLYALVGAGHAFKHGPVIGQLAADMVLEGESDLFDLEHFRVDRFEDRSPNQPLPDEYDPNDLHMSRGGEE